MLFGGPTRLYDARRERQQSIARQSNGKNCQKTGQIGVISYIFGVCLPSKIIRIHMKALTSPISVLKSTKKAVLDI